jgi:putative ABC transport system ATP-binding protein
MIEVVGVVKEFGKGTRALDEADLTVARGEWVAITGPSGSGKSTLLHLLAALDQPTSGTLRVGGEDLQYLRDLDAYRRKTVGLVFQLHNLLAHLDAAGNLEIAMMGTHRRSHERRARALELLAEVAMAEKAHLRPPELSGGERQRIALARALVNEPRVLLADEPTGSLDPQAVAHTLDLFERLRSQHEVTLVMVTHDPAVAAAADRIVRLERGRLMEELGSGVESAAAPRDLRPWPGTTALASIRGTGPEGEVHDVLP